MDGTRRSNHKPHACIASHTTENVNPYGTVPCLYVDGKGVFESSIICEYIEEKWPNQGTQLMPDGMVCFACCFGVVG
jgi:hypothetical protein